MITTAQQTEIREFLLSKNLPIDLLMEIQDHFESQIQDHLRITDIDFEQAFSKVKQTWFAELRIFKYNIQFDLNDTTYLEKRIKKEKQTNVLKKSFAAAFGFTMLLGLATYLLSPEYFHYFFIGFILTAILFPIIHYLFNLKLFKLIKKYDNYKLTWSQDYTKLSLVLAGAFSSFLYNISAHTRSVYSAFETFKFDLALVNVVLITFLFWLNAYCYYTQKDYLKQISKVQSFLKYLKASS